MEIVLLQSAQSDLLEILTQEGEEMYEIIDASLEMIRMNEGIGPKYHDHFHRKLVLNSPYGIFYSVVGERIIEEFPNSRMATEVREMIDEIRGRAGSMSNPPLTKTKQE